ncbi:alpha-amylase family protein [Paenibacillus contaminans]|uniref:Beta-galactosidase trimerisation domain-containing protein n=1 Tax=Paenibacillus contaminans TaxID=450362 RepID=A0A329MSJ0_9BACL|nr:alpha-amylase family protein [Paenibacillus contaminans]RAV22949.1 hypothetical protein DQG23_01730 [Paenibacillus contaminans]
MRKIKRAVHIDFHNLPDIADFGANFDAQVFANTLKEAHVEHVNVFAKCNIGFAYYPTTLGTMHPHLHFDMFGQIVEACRKVNIGVTAYLNVGLDHEMARKHRDWTVVNKDGQVLYGDRTANFFRTMCLNTGYRQYLLGMIREITERYPVEGFFLDIMFLIEPCYGNECLEAIKAKGGNPLNDKEVRDFSQETLISFSREVKAIIGPDKFLYLNGLLPADTEGLRTHIEIECLPCVWGYDFFPAHAAYARNLWQQALYMTGRFSADWADFGGLQNKASLLNDCWDALMNGLTTSIGDHMHPRDGLNPTVYRMIGEIYRELERLEPWTEDAEVLADIGILELAGGHLCDGHAGVARMLGELKFTYDIIDERHDFAKYRVLILPDNVRVSPDLASRLRQFIAGGGGVLSTGHSGLNPEGTAFTLEEWKMSYAGEDPWNSSYFRMRKDTGGEIPDMLCGIYKQGILLQVDEGAEEIAEYWQPYFNRQWDGFHGSFYTPPDRYAGHPAVAKAGSIIQFCFPVFGAYMKHAMNFHKRMVGYCLNGLLPVPLIKCEGIPSTARIAVTAKHNMRMIQVKLTHPEPRGKLNIIEDLPSLDGAVVWVKGESANRVYSAPGKEALPFEISDGYIRIPLPRIDGYAMFVVE